MITVILGGSQWRRFTNVAPAYGSVLGTVTRDGFDTGALVLVDQSGLYCQLNAGALRSLPQREVIAAIEEAQRGQGRQPADGVRGTRRQVTLDDDSAAILRDYGDGELSLGIRRAATLVEREVGRRGL